MIDIIPLLQKFPRFLFIRCWSPLVDGTVAIFLTVLRFPMIFGVFIFFFLNLSLKCSGHRSGCFLQHLELVCDAVFNLLHLGWSHIFVEKLSDVSVSFVVLFLQLITLFEA